jgi:DNA-binding NarL/FixJ family response regulator
VRAALDAGASGYLLKDADADEVAAAVRAASRGELQLDPAIARSLVEPGPKLTPRELDVVELVATGRANKEIADRLSISERTARTHVSSILLKLGLESRTQLALWAVQTGFIGDGDSADHGRPASG